jgi:hypothetical protein
MDSEGLNILFEDKCSYPSVLMDQSNPLYAYMKAACFSLISSPLWIYGIYTSHLDRSLRAFLD